LAPGSLQGLQRAVRWIPPRLTGQDDPGRGRRVEPEVPVSLIYRCDGPGCKKPEGEPRGPASALPVGWVCVVVDGRLMHMCLDCEKRRRAERDGT